MNLPTTEKVDNTSRIVINEAAQSDLPGRENGPADAYRHILLSAELTRQYGEDMARTILEAHEIQGRLEGQSEESESMDRKNNEIGIKIGQDADSWNKVVEEARRAMDESIVNGYDKPNPNIFDEPGWLDPSEWEKNPKGPDGEELDPSEWNWWTNPNATPSNRWPSDPFPIPPNLSPPIPGNYDQSDIDPATATSFAASRTVARRRRILHDSA